MIRHLNGTGEKGTSRQNSTPEYASSNLKTELSQSASGREPVHENSVPVRFTKISGRNYEAPEVRLLHIVKSSMTHRQAAINRGHNAQMVPNSTL